MRFRATALICSLVAAVVVAQPPAAKSPVELFRSAQELIRDGRFDVAAETLKAFLAANPTDQDILRLEQNNSTVFQKLRNVPVWSDNPQAQAEARKTVEAIIARAEEANRKLYRDPARIARFVHNLGESLEERVYAQQQLRLAGDAAVPVLVEQLRTTTEAALRFGILDTIPKLGIATVAGFLGALEGLNEDLRISVFRAILARSDVPAVLSSGDTDFMPYLWYYSAVQGNDIKALRQFAADQLERLVGPGASRRKPEVQLVAIARRFARHDMRYREPTHIAIWTWDSTKMTVTPVQATKPQADDYYALRYDRWALDVRPNDPAAQELFLAVAVERAVEQSRFTDVAAADPRLAALLAATPSDMLIRLLDQAIAEKNTAQALGLAQALAARADVAAATGRRTGRPSVFAKALDYPDPRVQLAAAVGLLRAEGSPTHGKAARIVEVLRRAALAEPALPGAKEMGRALIADPSDVRSDKLASLLRQLGYVSERFATSRELLRRIRRSADFDLIVIDRHVGNPPVDYLLAELKPDIDAARRPIMVIASSDKPRPVPLEQLLLVLAELIAVTETSAIEVPSPFAFDPTIPNEVALQRRAELPTIRDKRLSELRAIRLARLGRLVDAASVVTSHAVRERLDLRLPQLTDAVLAAEYLVSPSSAPGTAKRLQVETDLLLNRPELTKSTIDVPTEGLVRLIEQLETALDPTRRQLFTQIRGRLDREVLALPSDSSRDPVMETELAKALRQYPGVVIAPEPFNLFGFTTDVQAAVTDPSQLPRDPAEKKHAARVAVEWLRKLAVGEIPGFDVRPAGPALRLALRDDALAEPAIDAVAHIPTAEAQQDLLYLVLSIGKPLPLRLKAADAVVQHIQRYGKFIPMNQIDAVAKAAAAESNNEMKAKLLVIQQLIAGQRGDLGRLMSAYPIPLPAPPAAKPPAPAPAPPPQKEPKKP